MNATALPTWDMLAADAHARRLALFGHVRAWAAQRHARRHGDATPGRCLAALDALVRPMRTRLVRHDPNATRRDAAEAAADDLWDAVCCSWAFVRAVPVADGPPTEHVAAELAAAGRWLAVWPVHLAAHNRALAELFEVPAEVTT